VNGQLVVVDCLNKHNVDSVGIVKAVAAGITCNQSTKSNLLAGIKYVHKHDLHVLCAPTVVFLMWFSGLEQNGQDARLRLAVNR
jgi:hypothetical protein